MLGLDKKKLSKRRGALALTEYRNQGYLPQALLNMVSLVGWNPGTEQEIFTMSDLVSTFDLSKVQKSAAIFNPEKLEWINKEHMKLLSENELYELIRSSMPSSITGLSGYSDNMLHLIAPIITEHITYFGQISEMAERGELSYYFDKPDYAKEKLFWKQENDVPTLIKRLQKTNDLLSALQDAIFNKDEVKSALWNYAEEEGRGQVLWPLRYALSGKDKSPDPFQLASILGKEETLKRIQVAIGKFNET